LKELTLLRLNKSQTEPTQGVVFYNGIARWVTLELPWLDDRPAVSCIPEGVYELEHWSSPKHPDAFEVKAVPGRADILIHTGNVPSDTKGCIIIGKCYLSDKAGVAQSHLAMDELLAALSYDQSIKLTIETVGPWGQPT